MTYDDIFDRLFSVGGNPTEENWREAARLMFKYDIDTYELVQYINQEASKDDYDGWVDRAEMFETALYLKGAKEAVLKGDL